LASDTKTALGWLTRLYPQLTARATQLNRLDDYYTGDHPLPFLTPAHAEKMRSQFRQMLEESRSNFMRLLIDVVDERLQVDGFRLSATSDLQSDKDSWDIWQANQLDSLSRSAILDSLVKGVSYISVWGDTDEDGYADIAVEDATETFVAYTPGSNFRSRDAALKCWVDDIEKLERATVYLPDGVYKFARDVTEVDITSGTGGFDSAEKRLWTPYSDDPFIENPIGVVPIVPLRNRPRTLCEGESEISDSTSVQNQINSLLFLLALAGYFGAHKQRWATGITLMEDDETKQVKEPFDVAIDKLWATEDPEVKFGEFSQTDLDGYLKAIDQKVGHLAVVSRTPKHYLLPSGQDPSGDAIKSSESGLVRKIERKQAILGEAFEEVLVLARQFQGEGTAVVDNMKGTLVVDSEVVWADAATESEAVRSDATIKKFAAGLIPAEQALEDLGYSQVQIARMMAQKASAALLASVQTPPPPPPSGDGTDSGPPVGEPTGTGAGETITEPPAEFKPITIRA